MPKSGNFGLNTKVIKLWDFIAASHRQKSQTFQFINMAEKVFGQFLADFWWIFGGIDDTLFSEIIAH